MNQTHPSNTLTVPDFSRFRYLADDEGGLFQAVQSLERLPTEPAPEAQIVLEQLYGLDDRLCTHFEHEESLMAELKYPFLPEHSHAHKDFHWRMKQMILRHLQQGDPTISDLCQIVRNWLVDHIHDSDARLRQWVLQTQRDIS